MSEQSKEQFNNFVSKVPPQEAQQDIKNFVGRVICGDCLEVMRKMPENSIDTVITDPP